MAEPTRLYAKMEVPLPFLGLFKQKLDDLAVIPLKCMLLDNTYEPDLKYDANISQIEQHEITAAGYTRIDLDNVALMELVNGWKLTCDELIFEDVNWASWFAVIFNNNDGEIIDIMSIVNREGNPTEAAPSGQPLRILPEGNGFVLVTSNNVCQITSSNG